MDWPCSVLSVYIGWFFSTRLFINMWVAQVWNIDMTTKQFSFERSGVSGYNLVSILYYTYQSPSRSNYTLLNEMLPFEKGKHYNEVLCIWQCRHLFHVQLFLAHLIPACARFISSFVLFFLLQSFDLCSVVFLYCLRNKSLSRSLLISKQRKWLLFIKTYWS